MEVLVLVLLILGAVFFALGCSPRANTAYPHWISAGLLAWIVSVILERLT